MAEDAVDNNNPVSEDHINHGEASAIQAIDRKSVHRICSGQVVLTLGVAVKELVENSVDAGATSVEIKLKEYGSESIEVSDNGSGVEEKNFKGLTLKHHTSKLQDYSDLVNVETFGFRGEALSSLCALSDLNVITCHSKASVGTKLEFDNHGNITRQSPCSRQTGTTVCLHNLFHTLPVRYKEFQRNLKREFAKMVQVLNAYCVINTGVRINCSNQVGKGSRSVVVSTRGNSSVRENIVNIFGAKQSQQVLEFRQYRPSDEVCSEFGVKADDESSAVFNISGFISKCEHGHGRSSTDRQFIFINRRPCDSTKIVKTVNEVYHMYNRHQYPFLVLNITMDKGTVDVNVTPDKRQIYLQGEKLLLAIIKTSLIKLLEPTTCMMTLNQHPSLKQSLDSPIAFSVATSNPLSVLSRLKRSFSSAFSRPEGDNTIIDKSLKKQRCLDQFVSRTPNNKANDHCQKPSGDEVELIVSPRLTKQKNTNDKVEDDVTPDNFSLNVEIYKPEKVTEMKSGLDNQRATETFIDSELNYHSNTDEPSHQERETDGSYQSIHEGMSSESRLSSAPDKHLDDSLLHPDKRLDDSFLHPDKHLDDSLLHPDKRLDDSFLHPDKHLDDSFLHPDKRLDDSLLHPDELYNPHSVSNSILPAPDQISDSHDKVGENNRELDTNVKPCSDNQQITQIDKVREVQKREKTIKFSFEKLKLQKRKAEMNGNTNFCRSFRATISPTDNQTAEDELKREIKKEMFSQMEILGQFNLGFIIVKHGDDLFIVDQHATDEKYNFEMLQKNTVLQSQKLIQPQCLELTASNETILADNLNIFTKNGFEFIVDEEAPPTQRIKLTSTPVSKNWNFGKEDIEELIFMLTDSPGVMCRPSRVRMMFASRSCRKAVMIGTALNKPEMKKLICHMGEIVMPWNCPHGRPTIRHLFNLQMLPRT